MAITEAQLLRHLANAASITEEEARYWLAQSKEFRTMFEDYSRCRETASQWRSSLTKRLERIEEFEQLAQELEAEMVGFLKERCGQRPPGMSATSGGRR